MGKDVNGEFRGKKFKKREKEASLHLISEGGRFGVLSNIGT